MVLAQKETNRSMEQDREPRKNPHTLVNQSTTKKARIYNGEKTVSSISGGKTGHLHVKQ